MNRKWHSVGIAAISIGVLLTGATPANGLATAATVSTLPGPTTAALNAWGSPRLDPTEAPTSRSLLSTKVPGTQKWRKQMLAMINKHRDRKGLRPWRLCETLTQAAQDYAVLMVKKNWFAHEGPDGSTPFQRVNQAGYQYGGTYFAVAENIAAGYLNVQAAFASWVNSPPHNAALLNPKLSDAGLGYARWTGVGATYGTKWVLNMGSGGACKSDADSDNHP